LGGVLAKTLAHFWPQFRPWLAGLKDTRDQTRIVYGRSFLTWMGLMLFLLHLGARRQVRGELDSPEALENLNSLSGCRQETIAHGDTLNHFLGHVNPGQWSLLRRQMVYRLIRMKVLDSARLFGHFLVVIDGTGHLCFSQRHCPACLEQTVAGKTRYYHQVLEAKLVTPEGLAISLGSEFIENADPRADKQDCELKAFARLAGRLKKDYPQLLLCLLLDAIYAKGPVFALCQENRWKFITTFKEGSLPALWQEYQTLRDLCPSNRKSAATPDGPRQEFAWVEQLPHVDGEGRRHLLAAFQCREEDGQGRRTLFAWLTNFTVTAQTVAALANRGGRLRWKIENEGFNIQKNGGFALEHAYSHGDWQIKGFYLLMQIAHLIGQLIERGSLLGPRGPALFGGLRSLARRLAESLRNQIIPPEALDLDAAARIQIRLNSS
jgi:hypothetical protein